MAGKLIYLYGVHGVGKTTLADVISHIERIPYYQTDAIEVEDATSYSPVERQLLFSLNFLKEIVKIASNVETALVDFGPYQMIPYIEWWVGKENKEKAEELKEFLLESYERIKKIAEWDTQEAHVFILAKEDELEKLIERIKRRDRKNVKEEIDLEYISYVNRRFHELADELNAYKIYTNEDFGKVYSELRKVIEEIIEK